MGGVTCGQALAAVAKPCLIQSGLCRLRGAVAPLRKQQGQASIDRPSCQGGTLTCTAVLERHSAVVSPYGLPMSFFCLCPPHSFSCSVVVCDQVAEALMAACVPPGSAAARIMLFTGGPCTEGAGKIINKELAEEIRRWAGHAEGRTGAQQWAASSSRAAQPQ